MMWLPVCLTLSTADAAADSRPALLAGQVACVTAPRGNISTFWSITDARFPGSAGIEDGCGVCAATGGGDFVISSGTGRLVSAKPSAIIGISASHVGVLAWDNHVSRG